MLKFKKASEQGSSFEVFDTVAGFAGVGGSFRITSTNNFHDEKKRVNITITNKKGEFERVNCSKPLSAELRACKTAEELEEKVQSLGALPILILPQFDKETKEPVMIIDEETGEETQLILYQICHAGGADLSATEVKVTNAMLKAEAMKREINFEDLIAV